MENYKNCLIITISILSCLILFSTKVKVSYTIAPDSTVEAKAVKERQQKNMIELDTLTKKELLNRIKKVVSKVLDVKIENIKMQSSFTNDLGADDLAVVELVMAFEEEFNITVSDKDAETLTTVQKTYDYLIKRLKITK